MLRLACGSASTDHAPVVHTRSDSGVTRWQWHDLAGLRVHLLLTPFPTAWPHLVVEAAVGALWTWEAEVDSQEVLLGAALPVPGDPATGERLEAFEYETAEWLLAVGGPDTDALAIEVGAGGLPGSWAGLVVPERPDTEFGAVGLPSGELSYRLPPMRAGERARLHLAVAWRRNDGNEDQAVAPWFAVDTDPEALLEAAARLER